jgi:uncharacterized protein YlxW (UPF0749 family)
MHNAVPPIPAALGLPPAWRRHTIAPGQTILKLLHQAAGVAEANSKHALNMAQKLSHQLRAAENRIAELEGEVAAYQEKSERAERWLHKVYTEIEDRFLQQVDGRQDVTGAPQRPAAARRTL